MTSTLVTGIAELVTFDDTLEGAEHAEGLGLLHDAAVVVGDGRVLWTGPASRAPEADARRDLEGRAVIPGFVDSHAHLVFAGERSAEFAARMSGRPYAAGGIATTVAATRAADDATLSQGLARLAGELVRGGEVDEAVGEVVGGARRLSRRLEGAPLRAAQDFEDQHLSPAG